MSKTKRTWAIIYLILVHLALVFLLLNSDLVPRVINKLGRVGLISASLVPPPEHPLIRPMRTAHEWMDSSVPVGATIFLGDSITQSLVTVRVTHDSINYGIGGQTSEQLIRSMEIYKSINRAKRVVILIGTNDIGYGIDKGIRERLRTILEKIPADKAVVLNSLPPMTKPGIDDGVVRSVGLIAKEVCAEDKRCTFVDAYKILTENGKPIAGVLRDDDGVHLTAKGYDLWIEALKLAIDAKR